ncbi:tannase/feruloyl esterase family alpha/beta hydrolase [Streptomyces acidicola]|uniref:Tannase/feruloyl esterase family alpha/beta hydrolase n=1 Tax=Streptomyces acidicola TaxID=2596892 RepID=A0A5N8X407_9ACTN|nr:tannase/feruloyl esterase family alpha/beta hydrolase [Streptomyces acidicola]MPY53205.1 tannase/feruloyl esterase family alpha/beta hydrolase [Streptomyces acidicola]
MISSSQFRRILTALAVASAFLLPAAPPATASATTTATAEGPASRCAALSRARLPQAKVTVAQAVPAGQYTAPDGRTMPVPAFCRVHGVANPVPNSRIGFEVWLPQRDWNRRLLMFGNGGYSSAIDFASMGRMLGAGYVTVGTDTGHTGDDPDVFVQGAANPEIIVDWGHRAVHESVLNAKRVVKAFTGTAPRHSYFVGCSTGGQQALTEAQRYPDDFDGIVAGAPGNNRISLNAGFLWQFLSNHAPGDDSRPVIPASKLRLLTDAAVRRCRGRDGGQATDDFLTDPRSCSFDPASLRCSSGDGPDCLTDPQIRAARKMYAGARDPRTGEQIYPGWPVGSEAPVVNAAGQVLSGWSGYWGTTAPARANFWRYWVFDDPDWNWWTFDYHRDIRFARQKLGPVIDATDPDLRRFRNGGGKLLMYAGWADPVVSAYDTIDYYRQMVRATTPGPKENREDFARLFMAPGMTHCGGGPGPNRFDTLAPIVRWVEQDVAPTEITATKYVNDDPAQGVALTRKLRPYPAGTSPPAPPP